MLRRRERINTREKFEGEGAEAKAAAEDRLGTKRRRVDPKRRRGEERSTNDRKG
jgi:hypothetical protein